MAINIETLDTEGSASDALRDAWAAVRHEWLEQRAFVEAWTDPASRREVAIPAARLDDFLAELVRNPAITRIDIKR